MKLGRVFRALLKKGRTFRKLWWRAGMRYKVKVMVGLYQVIAAIPNVYGVTMVTAAVQTDAKG